MSSLLHVRNEVSREFEMATDNCTPWKVQISRAAERCRNPLLEDINNWESNPEKVVISLSIDDPSSHADLKTSKDITDAVIETILAGKHNGYAPSVGYEDARRAISEYLSEDGNEIDTKNIIICGGCASCLDICITALADGNKGQNILIPKPGYPLYKILAEGLSIEARTYNLLPECNWEVDLYDLEGKIDQNTAAIVLNNPSNACGAVYTEQHLKEILNIAHNHKVPIIADEVYEKMVFSSGNFVSVTSLGSSVPILLCGGTAKRFLVPGWRLGWIIIHDPVGALDDVKKGLICLSQRIIGSNTVIQGALGAILHSTPNHINDEFLTTLKESAKIAYDELNGINGLKPYMPQGAIYMMVEIDVDKFGFADSIELTKALYKEESILCDPGEVFGISSFMRIVISTSPETLKAGIRRIQEFCDNHRI